MLTVSASNALRQWFTFAVMNDRVNIFDLPVAAATSKGAADAGWIRLIPEGSFRLRDGRGPFHVLGQVELQKIVDRTKAHLGLTDLMIDYDHQAAELFLGQTVGARAEAAGWIAELQVRPDGIYGRPEWTDEATAKIAARQYRYISPFFLPTKSGGIDKLLNVALVNMPALDLSAVAAFSKHFQPEDEPMNSIAKALGLAETASAEAILAALNERNGKLAVAAGLKPDAAFDAVLSAVTGIAGVVGKIAVAAGLKADTGADAVVTAVAAAVKGDAVPSAMYTALSTEMETLKSTIVERDVVEAVKAATEAGKVTPAQEEWAKTYARKDMAGFKAFVQGAAVLTKVQLGDEAEVAAEQEASPAAIAARAVAYQSTQEKAGIYVSTIDAVAHVKAEMATAKK